MIRQTHGVTIQQGRIPVHVIFHMLLTVVQIYWDTVVERCFLMHTWQAADG